MTFIFIANILFLTGKIISWFKTDMCFDVSYNYPARGQSSRRKKRDSKCKYDNVDLVLLNIVMV